MLEHQNFIIRRQTTKKLTYCAKNSSLQTGGKGDCFAKHVGCKTATQTSRHVELLFEVQHPAEIDGATQDQARWRYDALSMRLIAAAQVFKFTAHCGGWGWVAAAGAWVPWARWARDAWGWAAAAVTCRGRHGTAKEAAAPHVPMGRRLPQQQGQQARWGPGWGRGRGAPASPGQRTRRPS